jgi:short-subunit dehydrogenase
LRLELKTKGVDVVTIAPGYIKSEMTAQNPYHMPFLMETDRFARQAVEAIKRKKSFAVIPWQMAWIARTMRVLPNWLYDIILSDAPRKPRRGQ